jgi:hypothetical protein
MSIQKTYFVLATSQSQSTKKTGLTDIDSDEEEETIPPKRITRRRQT